MSQQEELPSPPIEEEEHGGGIAKTFKDIDDDPAPEESPSD